jgi:AAA+ ATPase superfamily predicted ATPase
LEAGGIDSLAFVQELHYRMTSIGVFLRTNDLSVSMYFKTLEKLIIVNLAIGISKALRCILKVIVEFRYSLDPKLAFWLGFFYDFLDGSFSSSCAFSPRLDPMQESLRMGCGIVFEGQNLRSKMKSMVSTGRRSRRQECQ